MNILIAEDDVGSRIILLESLSKLGNVDTVVNGWEAICLFGARLDMNCCHRLICLDIMMPDMDGRQALRDIRKMERERGLEGSRACKIIMITSLEDSENVIGSYRDLCDDYIVKPVDQAKLLEKIRKLGLPDS